jgi:cytochrome c oxidase subunit III
MSTEQLALPAAGRPRHSHVLNLGVLLLGGAGAMVFAGLAAAYVQVRAVAGDWPPPDVEIDNYLGVTLLITALLSAATAEWAPYAIKRGNRRQALWGLLLTIGMGLSFLNLLSYLGSRLGYGVAEHAFGTVVIASLIAMAVQVVIGIGFNVVALARTGGHQAVTGDHQLVRSAAWYWQWVNVSWLIVFVFLFVLHQR